MNVTNSTSRPSFPPFRITFSADVTPSELSIIKDINKHCLISLSYRRYAATGRNKCFLLYANSSEQFDRLMHKIPSSYSIVAIRVSAQWNLTEFESDIKKKYPRIVKVERLYIKGGIPISKVRIDFSSNQEVNKIIRNKRLLLDNANTSDAFLGKSKQAEKDRLRPLLVQFKQDFQNVNKLAVFDSRTNITLPSSSSNEPINNDI
ncbi:unnamed protein product [Rotaria sp. Silwood2]|nr:unnamed protein product [Rotaria sp. Silwood2]CAF4484049.1 unnamed protein product [Rotaria sp. Silwood2]